MLLIFCTKMYCYYVWLMPTILAAHVIDAHFVKLSKIFAYFMPLIVCAEKARKSWSG